MILLGDVVWYVYCESFPDCSAWGGAALGLLY